MKRKWSVEFPAVALALALFFSVGIHAQLRPSIDPLYRYHNCSFHDGLQIIEVDPLNPGVTERSIQTAEGSKTIHMLAGNRIGFAYPGTDIFANVKAEQLPPESWNEQKTLLLQNFAYLLSSSPDFHSHTIHDHDLISLDVKGMTKSALLGGVLAFYLLFDNAHHVALTVYLVNQEPASRKFQTLSEFRVLESKFLDTYAACISGDNH
jgi:hypothetical protein